MTIENGKKLLRGLLRMGEQDRAGLNPNDPVIDRVVADAGIITGGVPPVPLRERVSPTAREFIVADDEDEIATRQNEEANGWID